MASAVAERAGRLVARVRRAGTSHHPGTGHGPTTARRRGHRRRAPVRRVGADGAGRADPLRVRPSARPRRRRPARPRRRRRTRRSDLGRRCAMTAIADAQTVAEMVDRAGRTDFDRWAEQVRPLRALRPTGTPARPDRRRPARDLLDRLRAGRRAAPPLSEPVGVGVPVLLLRVRGDMWQLLLYAGAAGGRKGVPESVRSHPLVFVTLTAPGFGAAPHDPDRPAGPANGGGLCRAEADEPALALARDCPTRSRSWRCWPRLVVGDHRGSLRSRAGEEAGHAGGHHPPTMCTHPGHAEMAARSDWWTKIALKLDSDLAQARMGALSCGDRARSAGLEPATS